MKKLNTEDKNLPAKKRTGVRLDFRIKQIAPPKPYCPSTQLLNSGVRLLVV